MVIHFLFLCVLIYLSTFFITTSIISFWMPSSISIYFVAKENVSTSVWLIGKTIALKLGFSALVLLTYWSAYFYNGGLFCALRDVLQLPTPNPSPKETHCNKIKLFLLPCHIAEINTE